MNCHRLTILTSSLAGIQISNLLHSRLLMIPFAWLWGSADILRHPPSIVYSVCLGVSVCVFVCVCVVLILGGVSNGHRWREGQKCRRDIGLPCVSYHIQAKLIGLHARSDLFFSSLRLIFDFSIFSLGFFWRGSIFSIQTTVVVVVFFSTSLVVDDLFSWITPSLWRQIKSVVFVYSATML